MATQGKDIVSIIKQQIEQFGTQAAVADVGNVTEVGDGIARIHGLTAAKYNELLQFPNNVMGITLNLEEDSVAAVILGEDTEIREGDEVRCTDRIAEVPVGDTLIGRVVDSLGRPIDGKGAVKARHRSIPNLKGNIGNIDFLILYKNSAGFLYSMQMQKVRKR